MSEPAKINQDDILFWLKAGMGLQEDKRFLLSVIEDLRRQVADHEKWRDHANSEYNKLKAKYDDLRARMQMTLSAGDVAPIPTNDDASAGAFHINNNLMRQSRLMESQAIADTLSDAGPQTL